MRDTGKVLLTFVGVIIMAIGLAMLIMPWLRDDPADLPRAADPVELPERIDAR